MLAKFRRALGEAAPTLSAFVCRCGYAKARMVHHEAELRKAWQDCYGPAHNVRGGGKRVPVGTISPASVWDDGREFGPHYTISTFFIFAGGGEL
jgi:hypothetical protein